ncbi:Protein PHYLLO chloroplastic [Bienertia sinuspersici]
MCPLRFILVFFSAILAGFLAWRSFRSSPEFDIAISEDSVADRAPSSKDDEQERNLKMMIQDGFWVFVDMASGRYLWRNLKGTKTVEKVKSS